MRFRCHFDDTSMTLARRFHDTSIGTPHPMDARCRRAPHGQRLLQVIATPMDLGTVHKKLERAQYLSADDFAGDVRLIWQNAITYNSSSSMCAPLSAYALRTKCRPSRRCWPAMRDLARGVARLSRSFAVRVHATGVWMMWWCASGQGARPEQGYIPCPAPLLASAPSGRG